MHRHLSLSLHMQGGGFDAFFTRFLRVFYASIPQAQVHRHLSLSLHMRGVGFDMFFTRQFPRLRCTGI
jgi:hypothetical protein